MRQYEMTYLVSDKVSDTDMNAATGRINGLITSHGGKVLGEENWGRRKLAYPINKQEFATYITLNFDLKPEELAKLNRELRLTKEILRYLLLVKDYGKEELKLTADEVAENAEIEEVVGGERSFEMVEGETEESYDLMAKREETVEDQEIDRLKDEEAEDKVAEVAISEVAEEEAVKDKEEPKSAKSAKKTATPEIEVQDKETATTEPVEADQETEEKKPAKKPAKKKAEKKTEATPEVESEEKSESDKKAEAEADRLAKLDEEISGILGDDL